MIRLSNVSKVFNRGSPNQSVALSQIDLQIISSGVTVLRGPSGSGKTTLLSLIGGMSRPTTGRIWIDQIEITSLPERFLSRMRRGRFGFMFQRFNLVKGISVLENVMLPAYPEPVSHHDLNSLALSLLQELQLSGKERQRVDDLSGGELQRTALARALINDPDYVVADEPTAHLDTDSARRFLSLVSRLKAKGKTLLMASHDPLICNAPEVDRLIELRDGSIVEEEAP